MSQQQFTFEETEPGSNRLRASLKDTHEALGLVYKAPGWPGWTAEHPALTGHQGAVHGFKTRELAAEFLYWFQAPEQSERSRRGRSEKQYLLSPELLPKHGALFSLMPMDNGDFLVDMNTRGLGVGIGYLQQLDDGRYEVRAGHRAIGRVTDLWSGLWACLRWHAGSKHYPQTPDFEPYQDATQDTSPSPAGAATARYLTGYHVAAHIGEPPSPARIDVVVNRNPDDDTTTTVFLNGTESGPADDVTIHTIDPGRSSADEEWWQGMHDHPDGTPPAVRSHIEETAALYRR